jgi:hypothetical protein
MVRNNINDQGVVFALNPADAIQGVIDWTQPLGMTIHKQATKALSSEKFTGKPEEITLLLEQFKTRGMAYGWFSTNRAYAIGLVAVAEDDDDEVTLCDYVKSYGTLTFNDIRAYALTYMFGEGTEERRAQQDDNLAYLCLYDSVDTSTIKSILHKKDNWLLSDPENEANKKCSAILFLHTIIEYCSIQTNATTSAIRTRLASLNEYIVKIDCDIDKFNAYVEENMAGLSSRGEETKDLLVNLWKAYKSVDDKTFSAFMTRQCEDYEMSNITLTPKELMNTALNKYKLLKESGEWKEPSETEKTILALTAEVRRLTAKNQKKDKNFRPDHGKLNNEKGKEKPSELKYQTPPKDFTKMIKWKGLEYRWCSKETGGKCDGKWRAHHPSKCLGADYLKKRKAEQESDDHKAGNANKKAKHFKKKEPVLRAVAALADNENDKSDDDMSTE